MFERVAAGRIFVEQLLEPDFIELSIVPRLEYVYGIQVAASDEEKRGVWYHLGKRSLSEMPLCRVWDAFPELVPWGYQIKVKYGMPYLGGEFGISNHYYIQNEDEVICLTAGQFVWPHRDCKPGERMLHLQHTAPDLMSVYGSGVAVLRGRVDDIQRQIGIDFS